MSLRRLPYCCIALIIINIMFFCIFCKFGDSVLYKYGAYINGFKTQNLLLYAFFHSNIQHLIVNMLLLLLFGIKTEDRIGSVKFALFYLASCIFAGAFYLLMNLLVMPVYYYDIPIIGASGAVASVIGFYAVMFRCTYIHLFQTAVPIALIIIIWAIYQLGMGILGIYFDHIGRIELRDIGFWNHIGGFAFGI